MDIGPSAQTSADQFADPSFLWYGRAVAGQERAVSAVPRMLQAFQTHLYYSVFQRPSTGPTSRNGGAAIYTCSLLLLV
jgi:hypothetical protein